MTYLPDIPDIDADFSEFKPDEHLEAIRQEHEPFLTRLEALAVSAIASNDWDDFYKHVIEFQCENDLHGVTKVVIDEEPIHKYKPGQLIRSTINGNIYRVENPSAGVHELHLIQFYDGAKVQRSIVTRYISDQDQYLELYQENA